MDGRLFAERLAELRLAKGVLARDMSLSLGQSVNYINAIESNRSLPSMTNFFYICKYLGVTPSEFFAVEIKTPDKVKKLTDLVERLPANDIDLLINLVKEFR
jgi:transcriptional regulator with XRE-family HTH domain